MAGDEIRPRGRSVRDLDATPPQDYGPTVDALQHCGLSHNTSASTTPPAPPTSVVSHHSFLSAVMQVLHSNAGSTDERCVATLEVVEERHVAAIAAIDDCFFAASMDAKERRVATPATVDDYRIAVPMDIEERRVVDGIDESCISKIATFPHTALKLCHGACITMRVAFSPCVISEICRCMAAPGCTALQLRCHLKIRGVVEARMMPSPTPARNKEASADKNTGSQHGGCYHGEGEVSGDREVQRTMLELLNQLDGFSSDERIKVIAATNRADILDPALLRSGRLDRKIEFPHPTEEARARILQIHSRKMNVHPDVNFEELARSTDDFNGAQLKAVCVEAGMLALRRDATEMIHEDFNEGIIQVQAKKKSSLNYYA
ncbi:26S protease regulatory subunit 6A [Hordeum vulgare]|nr:26S protease regulatory subunit 6A [Hordeum vulgare]